MGRLDREKTAMQLFNQEITRINESLYDKDLKQEKMQKHLMAIDQYLDKYLPVRV